MIFKTKKLAKKSAIYKKKISTDIKRQKIVFNFGCGQQFVLVGALNNTTQNKTKIRGKKEVEKGDRN